MSNLRKTMKRCKRKDNFQHSQATVFMTRFPHRFSPRQNKQARQAGIGRKNAIFAALNGKNDYGRS